MRLIREQLIDLEARSAASIVVGMARNVYEDDGVAIHRWTEIVQREKDLHVKTLRSKNANEFRAACVKGSVERRQRFLLATAKLDADEQASAHPVAYVVVPGPAA